MLCIFPLHIQKRASDKKITDAGKLKCIIALRGHVSSEVSFSIGFNYELLSKVSGIIGCEFDIALADSPNAASDSLCTGNTDLAIIPCTQVALDLEHSIPLPDSTVWVVSAEGPLPVDMINNCMSAIMHSDEFDDIVERFTPDYEPFKRASAGRRFKNASPYDKLLKEFAKELDWDWRMLAALVWQESRFRIEARSRRGAEGLLQVMETTALAYNGSTERLDPVQNLRAGTSYLKKLQLMFEGDIHDKEELVRFTLAAYNAGEGRLKDCIRVAKAKGLPHSRWNDLKAVIPLMSDAGTVDSMEIRNGIFKGVETIAHVDRTDSLYKAFCIIAP